MMYAIVPPNLPIFQLAQTFPKYCDAQDRVNYLFSKTQLTWWREEFAFTGTWTGWKGVKWLTFLTSGVALNIIFPLGYVIYAGYIVQGKKRTLNNSICQLIEEGEFLLRASDRVGEDLKRREKFNEKLESLFEGYVSGSDIPKIDWIIACIQKIFTDKLQSGNDYNKYCAYVQHVIPLLILDHISITIDTSTFVHTMEGCTLQLQSLKPTQDNVMDDVLEIENMCAELAYHFYEKIYTEFEKKEKIYWVTVKGKENEEIHENAPIFYEKFYQLYNDVKKITVAIYSVKTSIDKINKEVQPMNKRVLHIEECIEIDIDAEATCLDQNGQWDLTQVYLCWGDFEEKLCLGCSQKHPPPPLTALYP